MSYVLVLPGTPHHLGRFVTSEHTRFVLFCCFVCFADLFVSRQVSTFKVFSLAIIVAYAL